MAACSAGSTASAPPSVTVSSPGSPSASPSGEVRGPVVTEADDGAQVRLRPGQELRVHLAEDHRAVSVAGAGVVRLVTQTGGYPSGQPLRAVFTAVAPGRSTLSSSTDDSCLHEAPPCGLAQRVWTLSVTVSG